VSVVAGHRRATSSQRRRAQHHLRRTTSQLSCPREWDAQRAPSTSAARLPAGHGQPSLPTAPTKPQAARRTPWPSWSWLPNTVFVEDLLATNGIDIDQTDDAVLEKYCRLAAAMTTVINWLPGRTVVYYDTTLLESLNQHAYRTAHPGPSALPVARVGALLGPAVAHRRGWRLRVECLEPSPHLGRWRLRRPAPRRRRRTRHPPG